MNILKTFIMTLLLGVSLNAAGSNIVVAGTVISLPVSSPSSSATTGDESYDASSPDFYKRLGLPAGASVADVRKKYRELSRKLHPDRCSAAEKAEAEAKFHKVEEAYNALSTVEGQKGYAELVERNAHIISSLSAVSDVNIDVKISASETYRINKEGGILRILKGAVNSATGERTFKPVPSHEWFDVIIPLAKALYQKRPHGCASDEELLKVLSALAFSNENGPFQKRVGFLKGLLAKENMAYLYEERDAHGNILTATGCFKGSPDTFIEHRHAGQHFLMYNGACYKISDSFAANCDALLAPVAQPTTVRPVFMPPSFKDENGKEIQRCYTVKMNANMQLETVSYAEREVETKAGFFAGYKPVEPASAAPVVVPPAEWGKYWNVLTALIAPEQNFLKPLTMAEKQTDDGGRERIEFLNQSQYGSALYKQMVEQGHEHNYYNHNGVWYEATHPHEAAKALTPQEAEEKGLGNFRLLIEILPGFDRIYYHKVTFDDKGNVVAAEMFKRTISEPTVPNMVFEKAGPGTENADIYAERVKALVPLEEKAKWVGFKKPLVWKQLSEVEVTTTGIVAIAAILGALVHDDKEMQRSLQKYGRLPQLREAVQARLSPALLNQPKWRKKVIAAVCASLSTGVHYALKPIITEHKESNGDLSQKFELLNTVLLGVNGWLTYNFVDYLLAVDAKEVAPAAKAA